MSSVRIHFDEDAAMNSLEYTLRKKLEEGTSDNVKFLATSYYRDAVAKYVPIGKSYNSKKYGKRHIGGALYRSAFNDEGSIVPDGDGYAVRYSATAPNGYDYAKYQYDNEFPNRHTPGTYGHWNRHLTRAERLEFYDRVKELITERMNNG